MTAFEEFPKIARLSRNCVITEKIDGTNAQIWIERNLTGDGDACRSPDGGIYHWSEKSGEIYELRAGSRNRWITPESDNFGFARWAFDHARELIDGLGEGRHFGEWWGAGIQRRYGIKEKRFSLFNVARWAYERDREKFPNERPSCCDVVPVLYRGLFDTAKVEATLTLLGAIGSAAAPGFMNPEGIVIYHESSRQLFKKTLEKDSEPKGKTA